MPRLSKIGAAALAAFGWTGLSSVSASYLVVAGGGGSGGDLRNDSAMSITVGETLTVTVGAAGQGGGATGGGSDSVFFENNQIVTVDYTVPVDKNAGSFGPISINDGITVTVPSGAVWSIV